MLLKLIKLCILMGAPLYGGSNKNELNGEFLPMEGTLNDGRPVYVTPKS